MLAGTRLDTATRGRGDTARGGDADVPDPVESPSDRRVAASPPRRVEPRAFLTDFGLAKSVSTGSRFTRTGQALGTPAFMSPEQAMGEVAALTPASDVWALGCVLHAMLAGDSPFEGSTAAEVVGKVLLEEPTPLRRLRADVPRPLDAVVAGTLSKNPRRRPPDAAAVRDDLERVLRGERPRARAPGARPLALATLAAVAALALAAGLVAGPLGPAPGAWRGTAEAADPRTPERAVARARALRATSPAEAARLLGEALAAEPDRHEWRVERGLLLWATGEFPSARAEWDRIPASAPESAAARLYRGLEAFARLEGSEARPDLEAAAGAPGREGSLARAALAILGGDFGEARRRLAGVHGWEASLLRGYVEAHDPRGDPALQIRELDASLGAGIPFAWAHLNRGIARRKVGDLRGAIADYDEAVRLAPSWAESYANRGFAREEVGDRDGARQDYDRAVALDPGLFEARMNRGIFRQESGDVAGALEDVTAAVGARPDHGEARRRRASILRELGEYAGARAELDRLLQDRPAFAEGWLTRGNLRGHLGDLEGALADYSEAIRLRPGYPEGLNNRGDVRRKLRDYAGAAEDLEEAMRSRPGYPMALGNLGIVRQKLGDLRGAAQAFRERLRIAPDDPENEKWRRRLAECEAELGG